MMDQEPEPSTSTGIGRRSQKSKRRGDAELKIRVEVAPPNKVKRMWPNFKDQFKEILDPEKDPEKNMAVNLVELLIAYLDQVNEMLLTDGVLPDFKNAALIVQGSADIYSRKVDALFLSAEKLHDTLSNNNKTTQQACEKKDTRRERAKKAKRLNNNLFPDTNAKVSYSLSVLNRRNVAKENLKRKERKAVPQRLPPDLLTSEKDVLNFYDTDGEVVGNKGDYIIFKCNLSSEGWNVIPTINLSFNPDDNYEMEDLESENSLSGTGEEEPMQTSPDEGFESAPQSREIEQSTPSTEICSQETTPATESNGQESNTGSSNSNQIDEGIGDSPVEIPNLDSPGAENIPTNNGEEPEETVPRPVRQEGARCALRPCQLGFEDDPLACINLTKDLYRKEKIGKKNVRCLPRKLKNNAQPEEVEAITTFCARTFFKAYPVHFLQDKTVQQSLLEFDTPCFQQNKLILRRLAERIEILKSSSTFKKNIAPIEDEIEQELQVEISRDADEDDEYLNKPFDDNDIQVDHDPLIVACPTTNVMLPEVDNVDQVSAPELPSPNVSDYVDTVSNDHNDFDDDSDISEVIQEWERKLKPFLEDMQKRKHFDIDVYGQKLLNNFSKGNSKQVRTFREMCRNMEKAEIHRYFMALLPLANLENVHLETETREDGSDEIFVTLLSRVMHHEEIEKFGHNEGEHS